MSLSNITRDELLYGDAPGDGKGEFLRNHVMKVETTFSILFDWLTAAASDTTLPNALPIERGGTGGTTAQSGRLGLGLFVDTNNQIAFGPKVFSVYDSTVLSSQTGITYTFLKNSVGDYTITGSKGYALTGFKYILPKDELGNVLCAAVISFDGAGGVSVKTYKVKFLDGVYSADLTQPIDIPAGRCINISSK